VRFRRGSVEEEKEKGGGEEGVERCCCCCLDEEEEEEEEEEGRDKNIQTASRTCSTSITMTLPPSSSFTFRPPTTPLLVLLSPIPTKG